jgi:hypothetical protein
MGFARENAPGRIWNAAMLDTVTEWILEKHQE